MTINTSKSQRNAIIKFYQVRNYLSREIAFKINGQIKLPLPYIWFESFLNLIAQCIFGQSFEFALLFFPRYVTHAVYVHYNTNLNVNVLSVFFDSRTVSREYRCFELKYLKKPKIKSIQLISSIKSMMDIPCSFISLILFNPHIFHVKQAFVQK